MTNNNQHYIEVDINLIEKNIRDMVKVQRTVNKAYVNLNTYNYNVNFKRMVEGLYDEYDLLNALTNNLNNYFDISSRWFFKRFRITEYEFGLSRYIIKPPLKLDKTGYKFQLLKNLLIKLHKEYFLDGGFACYAFTSIESHMWEIPNFIKYNEVVNQIRMDNDLRR